MLGYVRTATVMICFQTAGALNISRASAANMRDFARKPTGGAGHIRNRAPTVSHIGHVDVFDSAFD